MKAGVVYEKNSFGQGLAVFLVVIGILYIIGANSEASTITFYIKICHAGK